MVQIFNEIGTERNPLADALMGSLPQQLQAFYQQNQQNNSLNQLAETLGLFEERDDGISLGLSPQDFRNLPVETKNALLAPEMSRLENKRNKDVMDRRLRAYEKAAGFDENSLDGLSESGAQALALQAIKNKGKDSEKPALTLNEELNQRKSRTQQRIQEKVRPFGDMDPITKMITFRSDVGKEDRARLQKEINEELDKQFNDMSELYDRFGVARPGDLKAQFAEIAPPNDLVDSSANVNFQGSQDKIDRAFQLLQQLEGGE